MSKTAQVRGREAGGPVCGWTVQEMCLVGEMKDGLGKEELRLDGGPVWGVPR